MFYKLFLKIIKHGLISIITSWSSALGAGTYITRAWKICQDLLAKWKINLLPKTLCACNSYRLLWLPNSQ